MTTNEWDRAGIREQEIPVSVKMGSYHKLSREFVSTKDTVLQYPFQLGGLTSERGPGRGEPGS